MKVWTPLTLIFALSTTVYAQDTCTHPPTPSTPPDGNTATKDDMVAGSKVVRAYAEDMDAYLKCVQTKIDGIPDTDPKTLKGAEKTAAEQSKKEKEQLTKKYDAAVDEEKANAERFNVQLRIWKAKAKS
jgi:hypothetical protein